MLVNHPHAASTECAPPPRNVVLLGATGSIGRSTLAVIGHQPARFKAWALVARNSVAAMHELILQHAPRYAVLTDPVAASALRQRLPTQVRTEVLDGEQAACEIAAHAEVDVVVAAIVGAAGLPTSLAAARAGKRILLANKEALVMAGQVFLNAVREGGSQLLPVDSEHNAVFQCLPASTQGSPDVTGVRRVILTASGGPFRQASLAQIANATPEQACAHPNWSMGRKISVDSATMMNKGLELIEAALLFNLPARQLDVLVHPQSIVHSLVEYIDGSVLAQLGNPDMRTPIAHALAWPERCESGVNLLDLSKHGRLDFEAPDELRFPCLRLAREALAGGAAAACVLNGANEIAVAAFLAGRLRFGQIAQLNEVVLDRLGALPGPTTLDAVLEVDALARRAADDYLLAHTTP
jgi:1-deoxy-D-xylulose-5-phosphate reductoisomerase